MKCAWGGTVSVVLSPPACTTEAAAVDGGKVCRLQKLLDRVSRQGNALAMAGGACHLHHRAGGLPRLRQGARLPAHTLTCALTPSRRGSASLETQ